MNKDNIQNFISLAFLSYLENTIDLVFIKDKELKYICCSREMLKVVGHTNNNDVVGKTDFDFFDKALATKYVEDDMAVLASGMPILNRIEPLPDRNGRKCFSATSKFLIKNDVGEVIGTYGIGRDITSHIELEEERERLDVSRKMFEDVLEADLSANKMITLGAELLTDLNLSVSSSFTETVKAMASNSIHSDFQKEFLKFYSIDRLLLEYNKGIKEFSHVVKQKLNGNAYKWVQYKTRLYYSRISRTIRITSFVKDVDEEIKKEELLRLRAETDTLTGLLNRDSIIEQIKNSIKGLGSNQIHSILFVDLDNFKQINDTYGHPLGDKILKNIADGLVKVISNDGFVSRLGGDEFLIFLKDISDEKSVVSAIEKIFATFNKLVIVDDQNVKLTCSIGVSMYRKDKKKFITLYDEADTAMYKAKNCGKNTYVFYD